MICSSCMRFKKADDISKGTSRVQEPCLDPVGECCDESVAKAKADHQPPVDTILYPGAATSRRACAHIGGGFLDIADAFFARAPRA